VKKKSPDQRCRADRSISKSSLPLNFSSSSNEVNTKLGDLHGLRCRMRVSANIVDAVAFGGRPWSAKASLSVDAVQAELDALLESVDLEVVQ
jgi:hypothetical protein